MEASAVVDLDPRLVPVAIRHAELGLSWSVLAVLEDWTTPSYHDDVGTPMETKRFRVRVTGPLPGDPSVDGEFIMIVRRYGDRPGWWISPQGIASLIDVRRKVTGTGSRASESIYLTGKRIPSMTICSSGTVATLGDAR